MVQPLGACPVVRTGGITRARILAAAAELFAETGFEQTTVRSIALRSGITDGALYYHFTSKRDILNALWDTSRTVPPPRFDESPHSRADLIREAEARFDAWVDNVALMRVLFQQSLEGDTLAMAFRQSILAGYHEAMIPSIAAIYGHAAPLVAEAQLHTLTGLVADTMLRYGPAFREVTSQESFRIRLRRLVDHALPCPGVRQQQ